VLALIWLRLVQSLRFSQHCRRQRVMSESYKRIMSPGKEVVDLCPVVVAFGAGMFSSCFCGYAPGPVIGVRQVLRERGIVVHGVNKDYKSQLSKSCQRK
jgi:hypothetical protein